MPCDAGARRGRMRVLMITVELPYLIGGGGGNIRQYQLIKELSSRHEIWLVSAALPGEAEKVEEVSRYCKRVEIVPHWFKFKPPARRWQYWLNRLAYLRSAFPFEVERFNHLYPEFQRRVSRLMADAPPDLVDFEQAHIAHWRSLAPRETPAVLVLYDVLSDVARSQAGLPGTRRERLVRRVEQLKSRRYEGRFLAGYDALVTVSEADRALTLAAAPGVPVEVVPNGVDVARFSGNALAGQASQMLFAGSMNHGPNEDAVLHFCRDIYPRIRGACPEATLQVVGRSPSTVVRGLDGSDGVTVTGEVPDMVPFLERAGVVVVPIRYGGGTRLKILEALAAGKAVVATSIGAAGIETAHGENILLADEPAEFADAVVTLIGDPQMRDRLGRRGRELVQARYRWDALAGGMERACELAVARKSERIVAGRKSEVGA